MLPEIHAHTHTRACAHTHFTHSNWIGCCFFHCLYRNSYIGIQGENRQKWQMDLKLIEKVFINIWKILIFVIKCKFKYCNGIFISWVIPIMFSNALYWPQCGIAFGKQYSSSISVILYIHVHEDVRYSIDHIAQKECHCRTILISFGKFI